jgi:hypothetical protein
MNAALHDDDRNPGEKSRNDAAGVAFNGRLREVRNLGVGMRMGSATALATAPSPEPSTIPISGLIPRVSKLSLLFRNAAASVTWSK